MLVDSKDNSLLKVDKLDKNTTVEDDESTFDDDATLDFQ